MRYFIAKNGLTVTDKSALEGDDSKIDLSISNYKLSNPSLIITEVDQSTFDKTVYVPLQTAEQQAWLASKSAGSQQAILFIAKKLGLE